MQLFPCFYLHKAWNSSGQFATILAGHLLWCVSCSRCCFASIFQGHWRISMMFHWLSCRITAGLLSCFCYSLFYWKLANLPDSVCFLCTLFWGYATQEGSIEKKQHIWWDARTVLDAYPWPDFHLSYLKSTGSLLFSLVAFTVDLAKLGIHYVLSTRVFVHWFAHVLFSVLE